VRYLKSRHFGFDASHRPGMTVEIWNRYRKT
jgi:hypothetical protein